MKRTGEPPPPEFSAADILALRKQLKLSHRDLATRLGVDVSLVLDWERGVAFPTLASARRLLALREGRPVQPSRRGPRQPVEEVLADPELWAIHRKLLVHEELFEQVRRLARDFPDPADRGGPSSSA